MESFLIRKEVLIGICDFIWELFFLCVSFVGRSIRGRINWSIIFGVILMINFFVVRFAGSVFYFREFLISICGKIISVWSKLGVVWSFLRE